MPFKRSKIGVSVRHAGAEESEVTITMDYAVKYGPLGSLMNLFVIRPLMRRMFARVVDEMACLSRACGAPCNPMPREGKLMEAKAVFAWAGSKNRPNVPATGRFQNKISATLGR